MFFWDENWDNATIISGRYHKATVNELIERTSKTKKGRIFLESKNKINWGNCRNQEFI